MAEKLPPDSPGSNSPQSPVVVSVPSTDSNTKNPSRTPTTSMGSLSVSASFRSSSNITMLVIRHAGLSSLSQLPFSHPLVDICPY